MLLTGITIGGAGGSSFIAPPPTHPLLDQLVSYWDLDEASGNRADSQGSNTLVDNNAVGGSPLLINNGAFFNTGNWLSVANNASLQVTSDFFISTWVYLDDVNTHYFISKYDGVNWNYLLYHSDTLGFTLNVANGAQLVSVGSPATAATLYHLVAWYDSSDQKLRLRVNDATTYVSPGTVSMASNTGPLVLGALVLGSNIANMSGGMDETGLWKRKPTGADITQLYNGGAGLPFGSF